MEKAGFSEEISCRSTKKLRLFGFDLEDNDSNERKAEEKMESSQNNNNQEQMMLMHGKRKCPFCEKVFTNSQALGGHQNAHKKERMTKKRLLLNERKASLEFYLQSLESSVPVYHSPGVCMSGSGFGSRSLSSSSQTLCYQDGSHGFDMYSLQIYVPF